jgi:hypothetical protein
LLIPNLVRRPFIAVVLKERRTYTDLHELLADGADVLAEGGGEHHHLLLVRRRAEYLLRQVKANKNRFPGAAFRYCEFGSGEINRAPNPTVLRDQ